MPASRKGTAVQVERGDANFTADTVGRLLLALDLTIEVRVGSPHAEPRQRDIVHARCVAYVQRRLEHDGWLVRREVEISGSRSHGWIDLLAFHPATGALLVIEVKTELHDVGQVERTTAWYAREAWAAARAFGWRPTHVRSWLLILATDVVEDRLRDNRDSLEQTFPGRADGMLRLAGTGAAEGPAAGVALIDPRSRRKSWLLRTRIDGRRSPTPYRSYADFLAQDRRRAAAGRGRSAH